MILKKLETKLVTVGRKKRYTQGSVNPVIQRASSFIFESIAEKEHATTGRFKGELFYGRRGTLTHFSLQDAIADLEKGAGCMLYPCGAAAVAHSILAFISPGENILVSSTAYETTQEFCNQILNKMQISVTWFIGNDIAEQLKPNTKVVFIESPGSFTMEVQDVPNIIKIVRQRIPNAVIILDNTWSAGVLFNALNFGVDVSIQAGTKYLIGHSDYMIGTAVSNERCWNQLRETSYLMGQMIDADTAYMAIRGLRTLAVRLKQHHKNSIKIAQWLTKRPEVYQVNHPAINQCPGHQFWKRDFSGSSGLFSFILQKRLSDEKLKDYLNHFKYFKMAYSWGGYESLILANQPEFLAKIRPIKNLSYSGTIIRLHVGLENVDDLIEDLLAAFMRINS
ncbi:MAG: cystathionine beta-lyase [Candidatus Dasytiphilus stammeri]